MPPAVVEAAIATSRRRMATETLDLLQFHWWDYADRRYFDALAHLADLRDAGAIRHLALTNFDTERLAGILDHGIRVVSNQIQFSLIDRRPEVRMAPFCRERGVHLLAYGTVCGGLLSERYLNQPEPRGSALDTASLQKYSAWWTPGVAGGCSRSCSRRSTMWRRGTPWALRRWRSAGCSTVPQ